MILTTLVYATRGDEVLMLLRRKAPNVGLWVAPGGKIEPGESPRACAIRELFEETGLRALNPELRLIVTELSPRPDWQWLMFVYHAEVADGDVVADEREASLRWFHRDEIPHLPIPEADAIFYPLVMDPTGPMYEMTMWYDADLRLVRWEAIASPATRG